MRIVRFAVDDDEPRYGLIQGDQATGTVHTLAGDPLYTDVQPTGDTHPVEAVRLLAPVIPRSKVLGVGRNYAEHAAELGNEVPDSPLVFLKPNTSVTGPGDAIRYPATTQNLHFEGELALVIGRICSRVPAAKAADVIFGYTIANDVTARDLQKVDKQWARAKGYDTFCPLGPILDTDIDVTDLGVTTTLNGEVKQDGRTSQMIFSIPDLIEWISDFTTLLPGDVILTGTPAGVGPMQDGDEVSVSVEGLGTLTNRVIARD